MTAAPLLPMIRVDTRTPAAEARAFLERDRISAAYALADLDTPEVDDSRWYAGRRDREIVALVLVVQGLPFRPCFATGLPEAITAVLREAIHEPRMLISTPPQSRLAIESLYRFERVDQMLRMAADASRFRPRVTQRVTRLGPNDLDAVIDLYGHASASYFTAERLAREIYYGIYQGDALIAAAGTHVRSRRSSIAAVGNVLTRLAYRGRGMATSVTSAVTEAALESHRDVVLNVRHDNAPAVAVYERLGFRTHARYVEGPAVRRTAFDRLFETLKGTKR